MGENDIEWINLSYANIATTSPGAYKENLEWSNSLASSGAAKFDGESEKNAMIPLRKSASNLLNCDMKDICVGSSATELLCSLAWAIAPRKGSNIVSTKASFPSTVYPWTRVSMEFGSDIRLANHDDDNYTQPEDILNLIDSDTAVVTISHVEYVNGQRYDLNLFSNAAHEVGALLIVDATQSMGVFPLDVQNMNIDALVSSGYKWLRGSFGAAVGYISPHLQSSLIPGLLGFRSHNDIWDMQAERLELPDDASRFEFSTIHFGSALGLSKSIDEICYFGIEKVWQHSLKLTEMIISECDDLNLSIASPMEESERSAIISIRIPSKFNAGNVVRILQEDYGVLVTSRSGFIRVSPHMDNTIDQISFLMTSLKTILDL